MCPLEQVCEVSASVAVDLKPSVLPSGTYIPGNTSPQVLHFNMSIGIKVSLIAEGQNCYKDVLKVLQLVIVLAS